jgi:anthranilate synthase component 2
MSKLLLLDNFDSFTYNLAHIFKEYGQDEVQVVRNNAISIAEAAQFDKIVLSPGPGLPLEAGIMASLVQELAPTHKILGVCLGHQCIGEVFGATLENLSSVFHGKGIITNILDPEEVIFKNLPNKIICGRYHSWVVSKKNFPNTLKITSEDDQGFIMSLRHKEYDVCGVQFHPESVLTPEGINIIKNWLV